MHTSIITTVGKSNGQYMCRLPTRSTTSMCAMQSSINSQKFQSMQPLSNCQGKFQTLTGALKNDSWIVNPRCTGITGFLCTPISKSGGFLCQGISNQNIQQIVEQTHTGVVAKLKKLKITKAEAIGIAAGGGIALVAGAVALPVWLKSRIPVPELTLEQFQEALETNYENLNTTEVNSLAESAMEYYEGIFKGYFRDSETTIKNSLAAAVNKIRYPFPLTKEDIQEYLVNNQGMSSDEAESWIGKIDMQNVFKLDSKGRSIDEIFNALDEIESPFDE